MNNKVKLTDEQMKQLPEDVQKGLIDGSVVALEVSVPSMSNRWFTVVAALLVFAMLSPIWIPVSIIMFEAALFGAIGWATMYWLETKRSATMKINWQIEQAISKMICELIDNAANKDGTSGPESCLIEKNGKGNGGTGTVH